jgi:hypothetical protein
MKHMQDRYVLVFDRVDNHVLPNRQAAQARAEVITGAADARISSEQEKLLRNGIDDAISRGDIATFIDDIGPDIAELGPRPRPRPRCEARRCAILSPGSTLAGKLRPTAPLHVLGQRAHGILGDLDAFAAINRGLRDIDSRQDFGAATLAPDPKRDCGLHCVFGTRKPAACHGLSDKILLLRGEVYLHVSNVAAPA